MNTKINTSARIVGTCQMHHGIMGMLTRSVTRINKFADKVWESRTCIKYQAICMCSVFLLNYILPQEKYGLIKTSGEYFNTPRIRRNKAKHLLGYQRRSYVALEVV